MTDARKRFDELKRTELIPYDELEAFWATLEPVAIEFMIGEWTGGDLPTGHRGDGFLGDSWYGTTFRSASDVDADGLRRRRTATSSKTPS